MREIELLAPAANAEIAIEAIRHGADAVYIGPPSHGARKAASNSLEDIRRVVEFAHPFGARVYATVNTIIYEDELKAVEQLVRDLYIIGVDALIVQDMGMLRLDLPPIALHASTQCDTRTPAKARFLQDVGFSQIVLARELTLNEIKEIHSAVDVPLECFVHGALCVSYSGRCHASQCVKGRSANRGACAQICRLPFTLKDADGKIITRNRHLLSLKDFNLSDRLESLMLAGVSSFKIEGRLKDASYVKNTVAYYRKGIDEVIARFPDKFRRSSAGESSFTFNPDLSKSFNRGFTRYFLDDRRPKNISSPLTPKSMGEVIKDVNQLHNGDGISFFNDKNEYEGVMVNGVKGNRIVSNRPVRIPQGATLHRTLDVQWQKLLSRPSAERKLRLDVTLTDTLLSGVDERGVAASVALNADIQEAKNPGNLRITFDKFGNTIYCLRDFKVAIDNFKSPFIPASQLADARRRLIEALGVAGRATYHYDRRRKEDKSAVFPTASLDYQDNVANSKAESFYREHGVTEITPAMEVEKESKVSKSVSLKSKIKSEGLRSVMTTRHCILREMGKCLKETPQSKRGFKLPLRIESSDADFQLSFDCNNCEMHLLHE
ncbi:MAG: U32 family peptidase [Bacteroides sp.]|nr:U32 family peptidase [Bacteroides sp.]